MQTVPIAAWFTAHGYSSAQYLRRGNGLQRILILDFEVHHGNGTQAVFYETDQVFVLSIYQEKLFPFTGTAHETGSGKGRGYTVNLPVPPQFGDPEYMYLMGKVFMIHPDEKGCLFLQKIKTSTVAASTTTGRRPVGGGGSTLADSSFPDLFGGPDAMHLLGQDRFGLPLKIW